MWDYLNRMLAIGYNNSTTTYAYDPSGARVLQTSTTSTTYYPNKYYSFTSTKIGANTYATTTNYIWNGDTLLGDDRSADLSTARRPAPPSRDTFIPIILGSTNAVTDSERQPGAANGLLPVRRHANLHEHLSHQREAAIHRAILRCSNKPQLSQCKVLRSGAEDSSYHKTRCSWAADRIDLLDPQAFNSVSVTRTITQSPEKILRYAGSRSQLCQRPAKHFCRADVDCGRPITAMTYGHACDGSTTACVSILTSMRYANG